MGQANKSRATGFSLYVVNLSGLHLKNLAQFDPEAICKCYKSIKCFKC